MVQYLRAEINPGEQAEGEEIEGRPIRFTASTPGIKRDGKSLEMGGWDLDNYRRNPVFLWAHSYGMFSNMLPLGRAEVTAEPERLVAEVTFDQEDAFARQVESKYRRGFLHAVSVGWDEREVEGKMQYELLDISAVPVPGDPDALMERQVAGMRRMLEEWEREEATDGRGSARIGEGGEEIHEGHEGTQRGTIDMDRQDGERTGDAAVGREGAGASSPSRAAGEADPVLVELVAILAGW